MVAFLEKSYVIFLGMILGCLVGFYFPVTSKLFSPLSEVYISLLEMCILPIIMLAILTGLGRMLRSEHTRNRFTRLFILLGIGIFIPSALGIIAALVGGPGLNLDAETIRSLGSSIHEVNVAKTGAGSLMGLFKELVPSNIFFALSNGKMLSIVFFFTLLGLALGLKRNEKTDQNLQLAEGFLDLFTLVFKWALIPLPIGLFCIMASEASGFDVHLLVMLAKFAVILAGCSVLFLLAINGVLSYATKKPYFTVLKELKSALLLALVTSSSFMAVLPACEGLSRLQVNKEIVSVFMPFGLAANRHGKIFFFAFTAIFIAQLYNVELSPSVYVTCLVSSALAGMAAVGDSVILAPSLAIVLDAMNLPSEVGYVILATVSPLLSRLFSMITLYANCALVALTAKGVDDVSS